MLKKLVKFGNSQAIVLDRAILELLNMSEGCAVKLHTDGKSLIITPQVGMSAEEIIPSAQELADRLLTTTLSTQANANRIGKQFEAIANDPLKLKAAEQWMPGTDNWNKMQAEYAVLFKKYAHCMPLIATQDFQEKTQAIQAKYNHDLSDPGYYKELMEMRAAFSPEIAEMDKEMMEVSKRLGAPSYV